MATLHLRRVVHTCIAVLSIPCQKLCALGIGRQAAPSAVDRHCSANDEGSCTAAETLGFPNHSWLKNSDRIISNCYTACSIWIYYLALSLLCSLCYEAVECAGQVMNMWGTEVRSFLQHCKRVKINNLQQYSITAAPRELHGDSRLWVDEMSTGSQEWMSLI